MEKQYFTLPLEDLPDRVILKILHNLGFPDLLRCGQVSKRIREISNDETLWQKINLFNKKVPIGFLSRVLKTNCKYLSLNEARLGDPLSKACEKLELNKKSKLIYLDLSWCKSTVEDIEEILSSCHMLEKLSLAGIPSLADLKLTSNMIDSICTQNGQTLQSLNLNFCNGLDLESVKQILQKCVKLKEVNFGDTRLTDATESYLAENLPSQIERLDLIGDSELSEPAEGFFEIKCDQIQIFDDHVVDCGH